MAYGVRIVFTHSARSATRIASGKDSRRNRWVTREATSIFFRAIRPRAFRVSVSVAALLGTRETSRATNSLGSTSSRDPASGTPRRSTVPPERTARTACAIARTFPVATTVASTPSPPVSFLAAAGTSCVIGSHTSAAPRRRALSARGGLTSLARSVSVPRDRRSWITRSPIGPAPRTRADFGFVRIRSTARIAHASGSMKEARSKSREGGSRRIPPWSTFHRGTRKDSANPPGSRFVARYCGHIVGLPPLHVEHRPHGTWWCGNTRAPFRIPLTPSPTSSTTPTASCPITGGAAVYVPRLFSRSAPPRPHARIETTISPGPGSGTGASTTTTPAVPRSAAFTGRDERGARDKTSARRIAYSRPGYPRRQFYPRHPRSAREADGGPVDLPPHRRCARPPGGRRGPGVRQGPVPGLLHPDVRGPHPRIGPRPAPGGPEGVPEDDRSDPERGRDRVHPVRGRSRPPRPGPREGVGCGGRPHRRRDGPLDRGRRGRGDGAPEAGLDDV